MPNRDKFSPQPVSRHPYFKAFHFQKAKSLVDGTVAHRASSPLLSDCCDPAKPGLNTRCSRCANTFYPLAGNQGSRLLDMVVPAASEGGGERDLINRDGKHLLVMPAENRWAVTLNEVRKHLQSA